MRVTVAIDSFKGSLTSMEAGEAAKRGILNAVPDAEVLVRPLADGGEGTADALVRGMNGIPRTIKVTGPVGEKVSCMYGILPDSKTAIIEIAGADGLYQVPEALRNPLHTTSCGVGEVILDAIHEGCRTFIIGLGGSATNDGGIGMLQALGFGILNAEGKQVSRGARGLSEIAQIREDNVPKELMDCRFRVACDVTNPLCGPTGASAVFGPQKGATPEMISAMDADLARFAELSKSIRPAADPDIEGSGAAGGLGFAFRTFLHGELESGVKIVLEETHLEDCIQESDLVVTGEGRLDAQTVMGKAPSGVADIAGKYHIPVIAFSGCVAEDAGLCNEKGIDAFFPILRKVVTAEDAMNTKNASENLTATAEQVFRLVAAIRK